MYNIYTASMGHVYVYVHVLLYMCSSYTMYTCTCVVLPHSFTFVNTCTCMYKCIYMSTQINSCTMYTYSVNACIIHVHVHAFSTHTYRHVRYIVYMHFQTDRQRDRQTDRQTGRQTDRQTDRQTHPHPHPQRMCQGYTYDAVSLDQLYTVSDQLFRNILH